MDFAQLKIEDYQTNYCITANTQEDGYLKLYLGFVKTYLTDRGLGFSAGEVDEVERYAINTRQTYFNIPFVKKESLDEVSYINGDNEEILTIGEDYRFANKKGEYFSTIKLLGKRRVFYPDNYLKLDGDFGFDEIPDDLHFAFLEMFGDLFNNYKLSLSKLETEGRDVSSLRAGNITYNFGGSGQTTNSMNFSQVFVNNSNLKSIITSYNGHL